MSDIKINVLYIQKKKGNPEFLVRILNKSKVIKSKSFSIGRRSEEQAYKAAVEAAITYGKNYKVTPEIPGKEELIAAYQSRSTESHERDLTASKKVTSNHSHSFFEKFSNEGQFKAMMKAVIKEYGVDKVQTVLESAMAIAIEAAQKEAEVRALIEKANWKIAETIYEARFVNGVDYPRQSKEIEAYVEAYAENKNRSLVRKIERGIHRLPDGITWDGKGHPPAEFTKYLIENPEKTIDDLRVGA